MRGLDRVIAIRRQGLKPDLITLGMPGFGLSSGIVLDGQVLVDEADRPETTDLRPLVGLRVVVIAMQGALEIAERWARFVCRVGGRDVALAVFSPGVGLDGPVWIRVAGEDLA